MAGILDGDKLTGAMECLLEFPQWSWPSTTLLPWHDHVMNVFELDAAAAAAAAARRLLPAGDAAVSCLELTAHSV